MARRGTSPVTVPTLQVLRVMESATIVAILVTLPRIVAALRQQALGKEGRLRNRRMSSGKLDKPDANTGMRGKRAGDSGDASMDSILFESLEKNDRGELIIRKRKWMQKVNEMWIYDGELGVKSLKDKLKVAKREVECAREEPRYPHETIGMDVDQAAEHAPPTMMTGGGHLVKREPYNLASSGHQNI
ncbi:hypothetical protein L1987_06454 [Smallanthus sonchifolius]|uniref:Uncharacterized protein n=1 Tax=Smallanthus sonchifolius TaxID=185202 RepID=A0ACB9JYD3_9ASTR|nr:hypothetical protein L1987_06454 [Smallanthus sonchifolius]